MFWLVWLTACGGGLSLEGEWRGEFLCDDEEPLPVNLVLSNVGGIFQGPGSIDYGRSNLGTRVLHFDLELTEEKDGALSSSMYSCRLDYAGAEEDAECMATTMRYTEEGELHGVWGGCPIELWP